MTSAHSTPSGTYRWLNGKVTDAVRAWRRFDASVNRPLPGGRAWHWAWLAPDGYPWFMPLLAILMIGMVALGPTVRLAPANVGLLLLGLGLLLALHAAANRIPRVRQYLLAGQLAILFLLTALLVLAARATPETFGDASGVPRLHVGVAVAIVLILALGFAWWAAGRMFRLKESDELSRLLPDVELFPPKNRYDDELAGTGAGAALVSAFFLVPVRYPIELLLPGSLLALFVPDRFLSWVFFGVGAFVWLVLFLGTVFDRLMEILKTVGRLFFIGPQFIISVLVVGVGAARLLDVHYITYLFNAGEGGYGNTTLMVYVALAYAASWYYAFWSDQFLARRLIWLLGGGSGPGTPLNVPYPYAGCRHLSPVKKGGRTIALHGAGRFKIEGEYEDGYNANGKALQFRTPSELLATVHNQVELTPETESAAPDPLPGVRDLQRAALTYPAIVSTLAFLLIVGPFALCFFYAVQPAELEIRRTRSVALDAAAFLVSQGAQQAEANGFCPPLPPNDPRIVVVASGGGTRAALYTASVLRGLAENGRICNVVLVSGVSGGSAALAYFALHERELRRPGALDPKAWQHFSDAMASPFIEYVLDGASDQRIVFGRRSWQNAACGEKSRPAHAGVEQIVGWMPARSRLGSVLAESFVCVMGSGTMGEPSFGIMLNTAMLGAFDKSLTACPEARTNPDLPLSELATRCKPSLDGRVAGGRLVLTNLRAPAPDAAADQSPSMMVVPIDDAGMSIARAAALSANFPPVFPDAAIDVLPDGKRFWVTDGGAVENRGAMALYLFLRSALKSAAKPRGADGPAPSQPVRLHLPPLHIVVADASAALGPYSESFGLGSVFEAGGQLGRGMEGEIFSDIGDFYCKHTSKATVHEIVMPLVLRDGGIGTHWLLPGSLTFTKPVAKDKSRTLYADDVKRLVLALHSAATPRFDYPADGEAVLEWARSDPQHDQHWEALKKALSAPFEPDGPCKPAERGGAAYAE